MAGVLYPLSRALLFRLDPETAHGVSLSAIARVGGVPGLRALLAAQLCAHPGQHLAWVEGFGHVVVCA